MDNLYKRAAELFLEMQMPQMPQKPGMADPNMMGSPLQRKSPKSWEMWRKKKMMARQQRQMMKPQQGPYDQSPY